MSRDNEIKKSNRIPLTVLFPSFQKQATEPKEIEPQVPPGYRLAIGQVKKCNSCKYFRDLDSFCKKFQYPVDPMYVCDFWAGRSIALSESRMRIGDTASIIDATLKSPDFDVPNFLDNLLAKESADGSAQGLSNSGFSSGQLSNNSSFNSSFNVGKLNNSSSNSNSMNSGGLPGLSTIKTNNPPGVLNNNISGLNFKNFNKILFNPGNLNKTNTNNSNLNATDSVQSPNFSSLNNNYNPEFYKTQNQPDSSSTNDLNSNQQFQKLSFVDGGMGVDLSNGVGSPYAPDSHLKKWNLAASAGKLPIVKFKKNKYPLIPQMIKKLENIKNPIVPAEYSPPVAKIASNYLKSKNTILNSIYDLFKNSNLIKIAEQPILTLSDEDVISSFANFVFSADPSFRKNLADALKLNEENYYGANSIKKIPSIFGPDKNDQQEKETQGLNYSAYLDPRIFRQYFYNQTNWLFRRFTSRQWGGQYLPSSIEKSYRDYLKNNGVSDSDINLIINKLYSVFTSSSDEKFIKVNLKDFSNSLGVISYNDPLLKKNITHTTNKIKKEEAAQKFNINPEEFDKFLNSPGFHKLTDLASNPGDQENFDQRKREIIDEIAKNDPNFVKNNPQFFNTILGGNAAGAGNAAQGGAAPGGGAAGQGDTPAQGGSAPGGTAGQGGGAAGGESTQGSAAGGNENRGESDANKGQGGNNKQTTYPFMPGFGFYGGMPMMPGFNMPMMPGFNNIGGGIPMMPNMGGFGGFGGFGGLGGFGGMGGFGGFGGFNYSQYYLQQSNAQLWALIYQKQALRVALASKQISKEEYDEAMKQIRASEGAIASSLYSMGFKFPRGVDSYYRGVAAEFDKNMAEVENRGDAGRNGSDTSTRTAGGSATGQPPNQTAATHLGPTQPPSYGHVESQVSSTNPAVTELGKDTTGQRAVSQYTMGGVGSPLNGPPDSKERASFSKISPGASTSLKNELTSAELIRAEPRAKTPQDNTTLKASARPLKSMGPANMWLPSTTNNKEAIASYKGGSLNIYNLKDLVHLTKFVKKALEIQNSAPKNKKSSSLDLNLDLNFLKMIKKSAARNNKNKNIPFIISKAFKILK